MNRVLAAHNRFNGKQRQNGQRRKTNSAVAQCHPSQNPKDNIRAQRHDQTVHFSSLAQNARDFASRLPLNSRLLNGSTWCTGKDSNLRTSLGGTDLQSVGFNHSPTCAENRTYRFPNFLRPAAPPGCFRKQACSEAGQMTAWGATCAHNPSRIQNTTFGKVPYGVP